VLRHEDQVLEPYAAEPVPIEAGLERDHVTRHELVARPREARRLVHVEADAVAEPVVEALPEDGALRPREARRISEGLVDAADLPPELRPVRSRSDELSDEVERLAGVLVPADELRVRRPDRERPGHVREARALEILRKEVADDHVVVRESSGALVMTVCGLRSMRDDRVVSAAAELREGSVRCSPQELRRERLAVDRPAAV